MRSTLANVNAEASTKAFFENLIAICDATISALAVVINREGNA